MTGDETVTDGAVVVGDRTVDWVGPVSALPAEHWSLPRADYPGSTIMPGLIDSHVHLAFDGGPNPAARMRAETDEQQLVLMLHSARELLGIGVTTARDLGARGYLAVAVRDAIATGLARGPRLVVAACPITVTGGHCWFMGGEADSEDDLRRLVRTHHKHGADLIKVMSTGGFMFVCPTISGGAPYIAELAGIEVGAHVKALHDRGVRIIAGTDAGIDNNPHHQYVGGLEYLVTLGFQPAQVLAMATTEAAAALGLGATTGRLAPGYDADIIVVDGDPAADISALGRLRRVIARGRDYVPDSGRFDVSLPGTPLASEEAT